VEVWVIERADPITARIFEECGASGETGREIQLPTERSIPLTKRLVLMWLAVWDDFRNWLVTAA
jgi:hypothetical protein